jgi:hypothetical protein
MRGRSLGRFRKRRSSDRSGQASAPNEQATKKSKVGLVGIVVTALVGFFFGIGSNQVTDYVKLAKQYPYRVASYENPEPLSFIWSFRIPKQR